MTLKMASTPIELLSGQWETLFPLLNSMALNDLLIYLIPLGKAN